MNAEALAEAVTAVRARLQYVEAAGARAFAPAACAFVARLLARGEAIGGEAGARLVARASTRAEELGRELEAAKTRARSELNAAEDPPGALTHAVESGDLDDARRAARRRRIAPLRSGASAAAWLARLSAEARARGLSLVGHARTPAALSAALYASSRDEVSAMGVAMRAQEEIPQNAGPYNPLSIAARTLAELSSVAPAYLAALVGYLDELSPLLALPAPAAEGSRPVSGGPKKRPTRRPPHR